MKFSFTKKEVSTFTYTKFGIEFKIGELISNLFSFIIVASIIFYIWQLSNFSNYKSINNNLNNIYNNLNYDVINISKTLDINK